MIALRLFSLQFEPQCLLLETVPSQYREHFISSQALAESASSRRYFNFFRKRFFEPSVVVKVDRVDTFSDRQERARAALAKSPSQLKVLQRVRSSQEVDDCSRLASLAETPQNDFRCLDQYVDDLQGGIEILNNSETEANGTK